MGKNYGYTKESKVTKLEIRPDVYIDWAAWEKIKWLLAEFDYEFCFLLDVINRGDQLTIQDIHVIEQGGEAAFTRMVQTAVDAFAFDAMEKKSTVQLENLKGWGHSHVNMGVFESGEDDDTSRNSFGSAMMGYCLSLVVNKRLNVHLAMHFHSPFQAKCECQLLINRPVAAAGENVVYLDTEKIEGYYKVTPLASGGYILDPFTLDLTAFQTSARTLIKPLISRYTYGTGYAGAYGGYTGGHGGYAGKRTGRFSDHNDEFFNDPDSFFNEDRFKKEWASREKEREIHKTTGKEVTTTKTPLVTVSNPFIKVEKTKADDEGFEKFITSKDTKEVAKKLREKLVTEDANNTETTEAATETTTTKHIEGGAAQ